MSYWPHDETCCARPLEIGRRFQRDVIDFATGITSPWDCTVTDVEPVRNNRIFCRRATMTGDDGRSCRPFVGDVFANYRAIDNVVALPGGGE